jgi:hypothetical protein
VPACLVLDFFVVGTARASTAVLAANMVLLNFMVKEVFSGNRVEMKNESETLDLKMEARRKPSPDSS